METDLEALREKMKQLKEQGDVFIKQMKKYADLKTILNEEQPIEKENTDE